jgi:hypothetical protein
MADVASALQATCRAAFLGQLAGVSASLLSSLAEFLSGETAVLSLPPLLQWKLFLVVSLQRPPGGPLDFARTLLALATTHMARLAGSAPGAKAEVLLKCSCYALLHSKALSLLDAHELADELRAGGLIEQVCVVAMCPRLTAAHPAGGHPGRSRAGQPRPLGSGTHAEASRARGILAAQHSQDVPALAPGHLPRPV